MNNKFLPTLLFLTVTMSFFGCKDDEYIYPCESRMAEGPYQVRFYGVRGFVGEDEPVMAFLSDDAGNIVTYGIGETSLTLETDCRDQSTYHLTVVSHNPFNPSMDQVQLSFHTYLNLPSGTVLDLTTRIEYGQTTTYNLVVNNINSLERVANSSGAYSNDRIEQIADNAFRVNNIYNVYGNDYIRIWANGEERPRFTILKYLNAPQFDYTTLPNTEDTLRVRMFEPRRWGFRLAGVVRSGSDNILSRTQLRAIRANDFVADTLVAYIPSSGIFGYYSYITGDLGVDNPTSFSYFNYTTDRPPTQIARRHFEVEILRRDAQGIEIAPIHNATWIQLSWKSFEDDDTSLLWTVQGDARGMKLTLPNIPSQVVSRYPAHLSNITWEMEKRVVVCFNEDLPTYEDYLIAKEEVHNWYREFTLYYLKQHEYTGYYE